MHTNTIANTIAEKMYLNAIKYNCNVFDPKSDCYTSVLNLCVL